MRSREELVEAVRRGATVDYLFFWGHRPATNGAIGKSCLSQWFPTPFEKDGTRYPTAEHFMMVGKADLFGDAQARTRVLASADPGKAKAAGRSVRGFDNDAWERHRWDIVVEANVLKFGQNDAMRHFLLGTRNTVLVEASPVDAIWGIGLAADAPEAADPQQWRGLNLLGFALMEARKQLGR